jgi:hypothetical protein
MKTEYKNYPHYQTAKWVFSLVPFAIAILPDSSKWILAYGFFVLTFGLIVISEQIERIIDRTKGEQNG